MSDLVIVESLAKAKTIEKYLGKGYKVKASMGHLRDLPKSKMSIDFEHGFEPDYQPIKGKENIINDLRSEAKKADNIYLATDPDREGEAISWHLKELLGIPEDRVLRVTFNEISKKVVTEGIAHPRAIDQNLVDAQQTRRLLDRIVGYRLSPLLWRKIRRGLSAGRVQSVVTRMVVDREEERRAFVPEEYWSIDALLRLDKAHSFTARFVGDADGKIDLTCADDVDTVLRAVENAAWKVAAIKDGTKHRSPAPPFNTSTLQQEANRKLNMQARRTMAVAQQLYEGVEIAGQGSVGLITYMRTDSLRLSDDAVAAARGLIASRYGREYVPSAPKVYRTRSGAQDAHEAIRPTDVNLTPEAVHRSLTSDQYRLYKMIWSRFLACQMENAVYDTQAVDVEAAGYIFRANSQRVRFAGFTAVYEEGRDDPEEEQAARLPAMKPAQPLELGELKPEQHFTQPPARYTEASLIKAMEERGVGRPSTYAPSVSTIIDRDYVIKENRNLRPTPLGETITNMMKEHFTDIIDVEFTANMERTLDGIEEGKSAWRDVLSDFYDGFEKELADAEKALENERIRVPDEESDEICELCGRRMVIKSGRFGRFLACPGYPECKNTKPITEPTPGVCPKCGGRILKKKSRNKYTYYGCEHFPECDFMTWDVPTEETCPSCGGTLFKLSGRGQKKTFCINEKCAEFVPEDKRGYRRRAPAEGAAEPAGGAETAKSAKAAPKNGAKTAAKRSGTSGAKRTASARRGAGSGNEG